MTQDMISLGFDRIIEQLKEQAVSRAARQLLEELLRRGCFFLVTAYACACHPPAAHGEKN